MLALDVIVKYGVGEKANAGAWNDLCLFAKASAGEDIIALLVHGEEEFKKRTGEPLPPAYRSAKSVLRNALSYNVSVVDANGKPVGKTAVEQLVKAAKSSSVEEPVDVRAVVEKAFGTMANAYKKVDDVQQRVMLLAIDECRTTFF